MTFDHDKYLEERRQGMMQGEWYTSAELHELPSLGVGQAHTQVAETAIDGPGRQRVWYDRTGEDFPVSVETLTDNYQWETTYEGDPRQLRIDWTGKVEVDEG